MAETGMVERVARAIAGEIDCVDWTAPDNTMSHPARLNAITIDAARAAIEAMPLAGLVALLERASAALRAVNHDSLADDIDAILKEGD